MNELALFAGAGGGILGGKLLGWRTVCAVEFDPYARDVLVARQNDGSLEPFPIWDDVRTFDGKPWRGRVGVVSGGFPCQDISCAGTGAGLEGARSGLWREMARIVDEVRPRYVFVENSPMLTSRGLGVVLGDLAELGFDARWGVLGADDAGAPHRRKRIWIVAHADHDGPSRHDGDCGGQGRHAAPTGEACRARSAVLRHPDSDREPALPVDAEVAGVPGDVADAACGRRNRREAAREPELPSQAEQGLFDGDGSTRGTGRYVGWWIAEPDVGRVAARMASGVDRLRCIGNGQVPACVALAWRTLT